jgi:PAS domain S-box-containing protein
VTVSSTEDRRADLFERVARLQERLAQPSTQIERQFGEALNGLQMALQELETAEAELAQQNEELMAVRERLEMERHRYRELFELAPDGYLVTDLAGTIEEANQAAAVLLGGSQSALKGKPFTVFIPQAERTAFRSLLREVRAGQALRDLELTVQRVGSAPVPVLLTVVKDEPKIGHPARLRWVLRDLSARKEAEARLRESEERLRHSQRLESIGRLAGGIATPSTTCWPRSASTASCSSTTWRRAAGCTSRRSRRRGSARRAWRVSSSPSAAGRCCSRG